MSPFFYVGISAKWNANNLVQDLNYVDYITNNNKCYAKHASMMEGLTK